ncbi:MAG: chaplin [Streptomycetaceae bacterium]|nr:chaplin [Streptomycetaceae bacterium]
MKQVAKKGLMTMVATSGVLAATSGLAYADAGAQGAAAGSPGVLSGNQVQVPVHVPVNACGNTVNVVGGLNPAFGNHCVNTSRRPAGTRHGGASANGAATGSPGVLSGNQVQVPVHVPVNACGNTVNVVGGLNPTSGNSCANADSAPGFAPHRDISQSHHWAPKLPPIHHRGWSESTPELAHTGADPLGLAAIPVSAGLLIGGVLLYRRGRRAAVRG